MLLHRAVNALLHRLAHDALAILLFEQRHRHFAFAEAFHFDVGLRFFEFLIHFHIKLCSCQFDGIGALEAFVQCLCDLHFVILCITALRHGRVLTHPLNLRPSMGGATMMQGGLAQFYTANGSKMQIVWVAT